MRRRRQPRTETAMASLLASLDVWTPEEKEKLQGFAHADLRNWRKIPVGDVHAAMA
jgi:L-asparaginase II